MSGLIRRKGAIGQVGGQPGRLMGADRGMWRRQPAGSLVKHPRELWARLFLPRAKFAHHRAYRTLIEPHPCV